MNSTRTEVSRLEVAMHRPSGFEDLTGRGRPVRSRPFVQSPVNLPSFGQLNSAASGVSHH